MNPVESLNTQQKPGGKCQQGRAFAGQRRSEKTPLRGGRGRAFAAGVSLLLSAYCACGLTAQNLYTFFDGANPQAGLIQGRDGDFYGTGVHGGAHDQGIAFKVSSAGLLTSLVSFDNTNGAHPYAGLTQSADGNFYGTTVDGGANDLGTIFRISASGAMTTLVSLDGTNGAHPYAGLIEATNGNLYGTTYDHGAYGWGTVFTVSPSGALATLVSFNIQNGRFPDAALIRGADGDFYGTTANGGTKGNYGTVFKVTAAGKFSALASFDNVTGAHPYAGLAQGPDGNFYGTARDGGDYGQGTVFKVTPDGVITRLVSFNGTNGANPVAGLKIAADGFYYGTTGRGGASNKGTVFQMSSDGLIVDSFSFSKDNGAYPYGALVQATNGDFYGTCSWGGSGGGNIFRFRGTAVAPVITAQPFSGSKLTEGSEATLKVSVLGTAPISYQWRRNGVAIPGASESSYTFVAQRLFANNKAAPVPGTTNLIYSVLVSNPLGSALSSNSIVTVTPDPVAPTLTISAPAANLRTKSLTMSGKVTDNIRVARVLYWFTNINNGVITVSATNEATFLGKTVKLGDWEAGVSPLPGTNIVTVQATDWTGNKATASRRFFYIVPAQLTLSASGAGKGTVWGKAIVKGSTVPRSFGAWMLNIGESYTIGVTPDASSFFANWSGSASGSKPSLSFIMEPGMELQANFVTNLFIGMAGTYNGLFFQTNHVALERAGLLSGLRLNNRGVFSGKLIIGGAAYPVAGSFDIGGTARARVARGKLSALNLDLSFAASSRQLVGTVSDPSLGWQSPVVADMAGLCASTARYTMLVPPGTDAPIASPGGAGYALLAGAKGTMNLAGQLADGLAVSQSMPISKDGNLPLYVASRDHLEALIGWINVGSNSLAGALTWIKQPSRGLYPNGFTNVVSIPGSPFAPPARGTPALALASGTLEVSGGDLESPLSFSVAIDAQNTLVKQAGSPTNALTGWIDPKTGRLNVSFRPTGLGPITKTAAGAVLQTTTNAAGAFLGNTQSGSISLRP